MGVPQFLSEVIPIAGRTVDLRSFAQGIRTLADSDELRPLRVGIDISSWIYKASMGMGHMLGDERHLSHYGRAMLLMGDDTTFNPDAEAQKQGQLYNYVSSCTSYVVKRLKSLREHANLEILVVIDGATPPIKSKEVMERASKRRQALQQRDAPVDLSGTAEAEQARLRGFRRAGAGKHYDGVIMSILEALRKEKIAFLGSPYESDGQLAYLSLEGYIDLIITEDSDLVAYGASPVLYKLLESDLSAGVLVGKLLRREDLAASGARICLVDFSPAMLSVMFVAAGSDYCRKLKGIGIVAACNIVRKAFFSKHEDCLEQVFRLLFSSSWEQELSLDSQVEYRQSFLAGLLMFRHPTVFDPVLGKCCVLGISEDQVDCGEAQLLKHRPYADLVLNDRRRYKITGVPPEATMAMAIAEGYVNPKTGKARTGLVLPSEVEAHVKAAVAQAEERAAAELAKSVRTEAPEPKPKRAIRRKRKADPPPNPQDRVTTRGKILPKFG